MSFSKDTLFPTPDEVPEQYRLGEYQEQREYLVNGELIEWTGEVNPIASPVSLNVDGSILPAVIGATPLLDAEASMAALDAAVNAYSSGHGEWPSMRIAERINHVEKFLVLMREQRDTVVKLLMWEIGKNLKDSEKEFDRTCDYIEDTCVSLKELDRNSAGFEIEQGYHGPDPSRTVRCCCMHGPVQLSTERNLFYVDSCLDYGEYNSIQAC